MAPRAAFSEHGSQSVLPVLRHRLGLQSIGFCLPDHAAQLDSASDGLFPENRIARLWPATPATPRAGKRILRFLQRRGVITLVTAPGDGEVTIVGDETMGEKDPLLARLLAAATAGSPPAGPATKRKPIRIVLDPDDRPIAKGRLCAQEHGFNLQAATRVAANDKQGRLTLCRYILRPPLANDRLHILPDGSVRLVLVKASVAENQRRKR
jgi:hypothetical protein